MQLSLHQITEAYICLNRTVGCTSGSSLFYSYRLLEKKCIAFIRANSIKIALYRPCNEVQMKQEDDIKWYSVLRKNGDNFESAIENRCPIMHRSHIKMFNKNGYKMLEM